MSEIERKKRQLGTAISAKIYPFYETDPSEVVEAYTAYYEFFASLKQHSEAMSEIKKALDEIVRERTSNFGFTITGKYGSGKTLFLVYLWMRMMAEMGELTKFGVKSPAEKLIIPSMRKFLVVPPIDIDRDPSKLLVEIKFFVEKFYKKPAWVKDLPERWQQPVGKEEELTFATRRELKEKGYTAVKAIGGEEFLDKLRDCFDNVIRKTEEGKVYDGIVFLIDETEGLSTSEEFDRYREILEKAHGKGMKILCIFATTKEEEAKVKRVHSGFYQRATSVGYSELPLFLDIDKVQEFIKRRIDFLKIPPPAFDDYCLNVVANLCKTGGTNRPLALLINEYVDSLEGKKPIPKTPYVVFELEKRFWADAFAVEELNDFFDPEKGQLAAYDMKERIVLGSVAALLGDRISIHQLKMYSGLSTEEIKKLIKRTIAILIDDEQRAYLAPDWADRFKGKLIVLSAEEQRLRELKKELASLETIPQDVSRGLREFFVDNLGEREDLLATVGCRVQSKGHMEDWTSDYNLANEFISYGSLKFDDRFLRGVNSYIMFRYSISKDNVEQFSKLVMDRIDRSRIPYFSICVVGFENRLGTERFDDIHIIDLPDLAVQVKIGNERHSERLIKWLQVYERTKEIKETVYQTISSQFLKEFGNRHLVEVVHEVIKKGLSTKFPQIIGELRARTINAIKTLSILIRIEPDFKNRVFSFNEFVNAGKVREETGENYLSDLKRLGLINVQKERKFTIVDSSLEEKFVNHVRMHGATEKNDLRRIAYIDPAYGFKEIDPFLDLLETKGYIRIEDSKVKYLKEPDLSENLKKAIREFCSSLEETDLTKELHEEIRKAYSEHHKAYKEFSKASLKKKREDWGKIQKSVKLASKIIYGSIENLLRHVSEMFDTEGVTLPEFVEIKSESLKEEYKKVESDVRKRHAQIDDIIHAIRAPHGEFSKVSSEMQDSILPLAEIEKLDWNTLQDAIIGIDPSKLVQVIKIGETVSCEISKLNEHKKEYLEYKEQLQGIERRDRQLARYEERYDKARKIESLLKTLGLEEYLAKLAQIKDNLCLVSEEELPKMEDEFEKTFLDMEEKCRNGCFETVSNLIKEPRKRIHNLREFYINSQTDETYQRMESDYQNLLQSCKDTISNVDLANLNVTLNSTIKQIEMKNNEIDEAVRLQIENWCEECRNRMLEAEKCMDYEKKKAELVSLRDKYSILEKNLSSLDLKNKALIDKMKALHKTHKELDRKLRSISHERDKELQRFLEILTKNLPLEKEINLSSVVQEMSKHGYDESSILQKLWVLQRLGQIEINLYLKKGD